MVHDDSEAFIYYKLSIISDDDVLLIFLPPFFKKAFGQVLPIV